MQPFTLLIKPAGSDCNLDCKYCFYKDKARLFGPGRQRMGDDVLGRLVKDYLALGFPNAGFAWQGGEPTLMGLDFYKRAVELQKKYCGDGRQINNSLQTNGILLDEKWCKFLQENKFLVGVSIDGPKEFHDYYRLDHSGRGSFDKVSKAIEALKEYKVEFNTLTLLTDRNAGHPDELFDFFIDNAIRYLQFIGCVERDEATGEVADFSITPGQYGKFLCRIFDRWIEYGPQNLSIRTFDSILSWCLEGRHTLCTFDKLCSSYIVVEHTGEAFCCDFFVEPKWRLGNLLDTPIGELATDSKKRSFARAKQQVCNKCLVCRYLELCRGGCMKDRAVPDKEWGRESYFCESYKQFFDYTMPKFRQIAAEINAGSFPAKALK